MNKIYAISNIIALIVLVSVLPACGAMTMPVNYAPPIDGDVYAIQTGTTINVIKDAIASKPGTFIYQEAGKNYYVIGKFLENGAGSMFTVVDLMKSKLFSQRRELMPTGNHVNFKTMVDFIEWLKAQGYAPIAAAEVPPFIVNAVSQGAGWIARTPFMFVIITGPIDPAQLYAPQFINQ